MTRLPRATPQKIALRMTLLAVMSATHGCHYDPNDALTDNVTSGLHTPLRATFPPAGDAMQMHCGTLDCHGQEGRNMRLYGAKGLRLATDATPLDGDTTSEEYDSSYRSIVGLEPEVMSRVIDDKAAHPEWLAMIRKPRGVEGHKGGQLMLAGDALDCCLVEWLSGGDSTTPCMAVVAVQRPYPP